MKNQWGISDNLIAKHDLIVFIKLWLLQYSILKLRLGPRLGNGWVESTGSTWSSHVMLAQLWIWALFYQKNPEKYQNNKNKNLVFHSGTNTRGGKRKKQENVRYEFSSGSIIGQWILYHSRPLFKASPFLHMYRIQSNGIQVHLPLHLFYMFYTNPRLLPLSKTMSNPLKSPEHHLNIHQIPVCELATILWS